MKTRRTAMKHTRRVTICATSIAAFMAASPESPGVAYTVPLGDTQVEGALLTGPGGLQKSGGGTLVLTNAGNNYTGVTTISNGSVVITVGSALGSDPSTVLVTGFNPTIGQATNLRGFGGGSLVLNGLSAGFSLSRALSLQGQGPIADRGGALISLGNNTLAGLVTTGDVAPGTTTNIGTTIISALGTLNFSGGLNAQGANGGPAGAVSATALTLGGTNQGGVTNYLISGPLSGGALISKAGGGTLFLNTSDSTGFSGSIRTNGGSAIGQNTIRITQSGVLGTRTAGGANAVIDLNGGVLEVLMDSPSVLAGGAPANVFLRASSTIFADKGVGSLATDGTLNLGQIGHTGGQTLTFASRNGYNISATTTPISATTNSNSAFTNNLQGGLLTFTGNFWSQTENTANRTFTLGGNGDTLINGSIVASAAAFDHNFTKQGTGTLTVTGTGTTLDGNFTIENGTVNAARVVGTLLGVVSGSAAGNLNLGLNTTTGTLNYTGTGETIAKNINLAGTSGGGRINANQTSGTPLVITALTAGNNTSKSLTLGGASTLQNEITAAIPNPGTGALTLAKTDSGTWVLSGANTFTGGLTMSAGTLVLKAGAPAATNILQDSVPVTFNSDGNLAAGGRLVYQGAGAGSTETIGVVSPTQGHGTVRAENGGALVVSGIAATTASTASSVNFEAPTASESITVTGASGFVRSNTYFNGANFAFGGAGGLLRAPIYGTDAGFNTTAAGPLTTGAHNEVTGSFTDAGGTLSSLKITGSQTLTLTGTTAINLGAATAGGIVVDGGNAVINGAGSIGQGLGAGAAGGALVIRVNQATDSLALNIPITNSTTQGLGKNGLGTLILGAANNQAGTTAIGEGTIRLAPGGRLSAANQPLTIRQGATLDLGGVNQPNNTIAAFNGAGTVTNTGSVAAELAVGNNAGGGTFTGLIQDGTSRVNVLKQSTGTVILTGLNTYTGTTTIASTGGLQVTTLDNIGQPSGIGRGDATNAASNASSLVFTGAQAVSGATGLSLPAALIFAGNNTGLTNRLFTLGGTGAGAGARIQASGVNNVPVVFTNTAPIAYTAAGNTAAQTLTLSGASTGDNRIDLQLVNPASNSLGVTKIDAGRWALGNTTNTYTGATRILGGVLEGNSGTSIPTASPITFAGTLGIGTGGVLETSGTFTRALDATGTVANTVNFNANGNFPGSGGFSSSGSKLTVNLGGASAPVTWGAGGFLMNSNSAAATLRLSSVSALGETEFQNPIALGTSTGARNIQVDDNGNTGADFATISGAISGSAPAGGITKTGGGTLYLTGNSTFTGTTTISAGSLVVRSLGNSSAPGATSVGDSTAGNTDAGAVLIGNGSTGVAILQYAGAGETTDRKIRLNTTTGTTQIHADGAGPLVLTNIVNDVPASLAKNLTLRGTNAGGNRITGGLTDSPVLGTAAGALSVTVDGSATWILEGANTYTGNTNANAGALGIGAGATPIGTGTLSLNNGSIFAYGADRTITNPVLLQNNTTAGVFGDNSVILSGPLLTNAGANNIGLNNNVAAGKTFTVQGITADSLTATRVLTIDGPGETVINGNITYTGTAAFGLSLTKTGTGVLRLNGAGGNFAQGNATVDIDNGTVILGATNALLGASATAANVTFSPDNGQNETGTLNLNGFSQTISALTGTNTSASTIDNASAVPVTLTVGSNNGAVNSNASLTNSGGGAMSLVKAGTAAGTLSGTTITYSGTTTVQNGSLSFPVSDPVNTTGITVAGNAGLSLINGTGTPRSGLTVLDLGAGAGTTAVGLDLGTTSDTLTVVPAAVTANTVNFSIGAAPGFGSSPTYTLLAAPAGGLGGATYALNGTVPGGFTYSLTPSATSVILNVTATAPGTKFWRGDINGSWSTYVSGNTNWEDPGGSDPASTPGPLDVVVFSSTLNPPGSAFVTTLDASVAIDSLQFNGSNTSTTGARVNIGAGVGGTLTISPAASTDGIELPDNGGVASIGAPVVVAADQTWFVGSVGSPRPELIVSGPLSGTGNITKLGTGTASITGTSTRTGRTVIQAGTVRIQSEASLGGNPVAADAQSITLDGATATLRSIAALTIDDANRGITIGTNGGTIDTTGGNITIGSTATPSLNPIAGTGALRKEAGNTLILNSASPGFSGPVVVNGGAVRAGVNGSLGTGGVQLINTVVLEAGDGVNVGNPVTISGNGNDKTLRLLAGASTGAFSGAITVSEETAGNLRAQASAGGVLTVSGAITTTGTFAPGLRVNEVAGNTGTVILSGANDYAGNTEVRSGTLQNGASDVIGRTGTGASTLTVNAAIAASPSATYSTGNFNETLTGLTFGAAGSSTAAYVNNVTTGTGTLTLGGNVTTVAGTSSASANLSGNVAVNAVRTFTVADATNQAVDLAVSAVITGGAGTGITKTGAGTMSITGNSPAYTGATAVNQGGLLVTGSISGSTVAVSATGTLSGTGTVGAITATGGTVAPGNAGIGTLSASSATFSGTATLALQINTSTVIPQTDVLNSTGPLSLSLTGTPLTIADLGSTTLPLGTQLVFANYTGAQTGLFSVGGTPIADDIQFFTIGLNQFAIDYNLNGNSVALIAVPEPGIAASLLGGFGMLVGLQRLRRRSDRRA